MSAFDTYRATRDSALRNGESARAEAAQANALRTRQDAGGMIAAGDMTGGANALLGSGDIAGGLGVINQGRENDAAQATAANAAQERQRQTVLRGAQGLMRLPEEQWMTTFQSQVAPQLEQVGLGHLIPQIAQDGISRQELEAVIASLGGETPDAPSGYRWGSDGRQEFIPGGPQDPANRPWQVTPWGYAPPPGWTPDQIPAGGGAPQGQPQTLGSAIPPGWSAAPPRPNQPSSAPAAGGGERSQPVSVSFQSSRDAQSAIAQLVPGVRVTSGARSPDDNRRVGGAPGSYHLQDRARDLVPPAGMTMAQLAAKMRQAGFRALDEGDHVHVSW